MLPAGGDQRLCDDILLLLMPAYARFHTDDHALAWRARRVRVIAIVAVVGRVLSSASTGVSATARRMHAMITGM